MKIENKFKNIIKVLILISVSLLLFYIYVGTYFIKLLKDGEFSANVDVSIKVEPNIDVELFKISPTGNEERILLYISDDNSTYKGSIYGRHIKNLALKISNRYFINFIKEVNIKIKDKNFIYNNEDLRKFWKEENDFENIFISPDTIKYQVSYLNKYTKLFDTINWIGDSQVRKYLIINILERLIKVILLILLMFLFIIKHKEILNFYQKIISKPSLTQIKINNTTKNIFFFVFLVFLAIIIRFYSFDNVIHVDEPSYIVIADKILKGNTLYSEVWDTKAPGLFLYYILIVGIFKSFFGIRLAGAIFIGATGFVIFNVLSKIIEQEKKNLTQNDITFFSNIPYIGGIAYIFISSFHRWNYWINPEQIVIFYTLLGLYFLLLDKKYSVFVCSLFLGMSFITKYPAVIDYVAIAVLWLIIQIRKGNKISYFVKNIILSVIGFLTPFLVVIFIYFLNGHLKDYFDAIYFVSFKYPAKKTLIGIINTLGKFVLELTPMFILWIMGLIYIIIKRLKFIGLILLGLGLSSLMCILSTGNDFTYYWFQFWGIVALTIPFAIKLLESIINFFSKRQINYLLFYILTVIFISDYFILWTKEEWGKKEPLFEVANYLKDKISKQDTLIAFGEGSHILYFLLDLKVPTIYVHPYNNWGGLKEFRRMAKLKPLYIVDSGPDGFWYNYTSKYYKIDYVIEKHIIYKLKRF